MMARNENPNLLARHPLASKVALAVLALVVVDLVAARIYRWDIDRQSPNIKQYPVPYEFGLQPDRSVLSAIWGSRIYKLHTNSLGFRDARRRDVPLTTTNAHRVVFIGDSFTYGIGCDYEETFVGRVAEALGPQGVEVLNAAVDGYSTFHYLRKIQYYVEEVGLRFDELVCCIDLTDISEDLMTLRRIEARGESILEEDRSAVRQVSKQGFRLPPFPHVSKFRHRLRRSSLLVEMLYRVKLMIRPALPLDQRTVLWTSEERYFEEFGRQGMEVAMENMARLHQLLRSHGMKLSIVVYPWPDQVVRRDLESRQVRMWREWCKARDVAFINAFPAFMTMADPMDAVRKYFIRGDFHFNEAGHRIMAECLLKEMKNSREKAQKPQKR